MTDDELERLYKATVTHSHAAALRALFEAGRASVQKAPAEPLVKTPPAPTTTTVKPK
jgi:hypothetical protein